MFEFSTDQTNAIDSLMSWHKNPADGFITFAGFAGTGKTTVLGHLRNILPETIRIAFCAYTGKAASVLKSKLIKCGIVKNPDDYCGTIHGLIYVPPEEREEDVSDVKWILKSIIEYDLIICDEASMVSEPIFNDLMSFHKPIIFAGDHGQLPPIEGTLNLMANPLIRLEKVHRFAEKNPLTKISMLARIDGYIPHGKYGDLVIKVPKNHSLITDFINHSGTFESTAILCGFNATRTEINQNIRKWFKRKGNVPLIGERIICLRNNAQASKCPIYNGVIGTVQECHSRFDHLFARVSIDGEEKHFIGKISKNVFNNKSPNLSEWIIEEIEDNDDVDVDKAYRFLNHKTESKKKSKKRYLDCFDFGYALTVHKSQGSEWERVMVIEQPCQYWSGELWNRWLYTAVTRSKNELLIVR